MVGLGVGGLGLGGAADAPDGMENIAYNHNMIATFASSTQLDSAVDMTIMSLLYLGRGVGNWGRWGGLSPRVFWSLHTKPA